MTGIVNLIHSISYSITEHETQVARFMTVKRRNTATALKQECNHRAILMEKQYQYHWFVKQGRLGISSDKALIYIDVDDEGAPACILTPEDTHDVIHLLTEFARDIWEHSDDQVSHQATPLRTWGEIQASDYQWQTPTGTLTLLPLANTPDIQISATSLEKLPLSMGQAIEMVQTLEILLASLESLE